MNGANADNSVDADDGRDGPVRICVFTPSPFYTVTVECSADGSDEVHFHAGGQGFWVARMARQLGAEVALVGPFGGESGAILQTLIEGEGVAVAAVAAQGWNGGYLHDRRSGERRSVAVVDSPRLSRHETDNLYNAALSRGFLSDVMVLTGPSHDRVLPADLYARLASDLPQNGVPVVADVSGEILLRAAERLDVLKVSERELQEAGLCEVDSPEQISTAIRRLHDRGVKNIVVSRAESGVIALYEDRLYRASPPAFRTADHRGAGDSMTAALAVCLGARMPTEATLRFAVAAGALNVTRHGLGTGSRDDIDVIAERVEVEELV